MEVKINTLLCRILDVFSKKLQNPVAVLFNFPCQYLHCCLVIYLSGIYKYSYIIYVPYMYI